MNGNMINDLDYGPLALLVGQWKGDKGIDTSPKPTGEDKTAYTETLLFEAIGDVTNGGIQKLVALRYHQVVSRKSDNAVFHNETGYWMWDAEEDVIMHSLTIPRGVCILAGGKAIKQADTTILEVQAVFGDESWGIIQSPFMREKARTEKFTHQMTVSENNLSYTETISLAIYDKQFDHTDTNVLTRA